MSKILNKLIGAKKGPKELVLAGKEALLVLEENLAAVTAAGVTPAPPGSGSTGINSTSSSGGDAVAVSDSTAQSLMEAVAKRNQATAGTGDGNGKAQDAAANAVVALAAHAAALRADPKQAKAVEDLNKVLDQLKQLLYGAGEQEPKKQDQLDIAQHAYSSDLLLLLVKHLSQLEFESRKHAMQIFNNLIRLQQGPKFTTVDYIVANRMEVLYYLLFGYEDPEIALLTGSMLRECIKHEVLAKELLWSSEVYRLFSYVDLQNFEVASDAFVTLRDLLSRHKSMCAEFLDTNFDRFFAEYRTLLTSNNYVTKRQSIRLLGEILLDRSNFNVMTRYINMEDNLKLMMNLLLEKSRNIQFEAFHVFKVFVANPNKAQPIKDILSMNKDQLAKYLQTFHTEREQEDEEFAEEKQLLLNEI